MEFREITSVENSGNETDGFPVEPERQRRASISYSPFNGVQVPEAYEVLNNLHRNQAERQVAYYLAEWMNGQVRQ